MSGPWLTVIVMVPLTPQSYEVRRVHLRSTNNNHQRRVSPHYCCPFPFTELMSTMYKRSLTDAQVHKVLGDIDTDEVSGSICPSAAPSPALSL